MRRLISIIGLAIIGLCINNVNANKSKYIAMGNLQVVIRGETLFSTDIQSNRTLTPDLWCQLREGDEPVAATWARFVRTKDRKAFMADIDPNENRAILHFGQSSADHSGKYRCEIKAPDGTIVFGNMFAYAHVVVRNNDSWPVTKSEKELGLVEAPVSYASYQSTAYLSCPIAGYPEPNIYWFKNNFPVEYDERISFDEKSQVLKIDDVSDNDAGIYRCVATNQFPVKIDGPEQEFSVKLEQELRVGDGYGWMLPLAIIIIILLILFLVIFICQRCSKYKADHYNVAEREHALHQDQVPLKNSV